MAAPIIIPVGGNAQGLYNEIVRQAKRAEDVIKRTPLRLETRNFGAIKGFTADIDRFDKSLTRMSAVIQTFGQSAAILFGVQRAMLGLVKTTIDVEKRMADLQTVLGGTNVEFEKLGKGLFDVAKLTGQSFATVSDAAKEFARQGLGVQETLKRTRDALILTRTTGLDVESSVQDLTATLNTFKKEALDSTKVINTFRNVDTKFAVSAADLAESIKRAGASAFDAKVSFAELNAATTSLQQTTARGGSTIGNSLKAIFTRVQRSSTIESLEEIGVAAKDAEGDIRPFMDIMQDLAFAIQNVSDVQKAQIKETVAGAYQINALSALLQDLSSEYSVYNQALQTANNTTNEAIKSNEQLNKTTAAILNETLQNITQVSAKIGEISIQPFIKNTLNAVNELFTTFQNLGEGSIGAQIGKGLLEGISNFLQGPGIAIFSAGLFKLSRLVFKGAFDQAKSVLTLSKTNENILENQRRVSSVLSSQDPLVQKLIAGSRNRLELEQNIARVISQQNTGLSFRENLSRSVAASLTRRGARGAAGGYIPDMAAEKLAVMKGVGGAPSSARPVVVPNFNMGGGKRGTIVANDSEYLVPNFAGGGSAIFNREMIEKFGLPKGAQKIAAGGFIPSLASKLRFKKVDKSIRKMELGDSGSYLDYYLNKDRSALNIDFMESFQKGDAFKLFNKAKKLGSRLGIRKIHSDDIVSQGYKYTPEELDSIASGSRLDALFKVFPQMRYRDQKGVKTSGLFTNFLSKESKRFKSPRGLARHLEGIPDDEFRKLIGANELIGLGQVTSKFAGGYIPNMAVIANTLKQKQYFNSLKAYSGPIDSAMSLVKGVGGKTPDIAILENLSSILGSKSKANSPTSAGVLDSVNNMVGLNRRFLSGQSTAYGANTLLHEIGHKIHYSLLDRSMFGSPNFSKNALKVTSNLDRAYDLSKKKKYAGASSLGNSFAETLPFYKPKDRAAENIAQAFAEVMLPFKSNSGSGDAKRNPLFRYIRRLTGKAMGNFAGGTPLTESLQREAKSLEDLGFPKGLITDSLRVQSSGRLKNGQNPMGLGVFNTLQGQTNINKALMDHHGENFYASGHVPNFASYKPLSTRFNAFGFGNQSLSRTVQAAGIQFRLPVRDFRNIRSADTRSLTEYVENLADSAELVNKNRGRFTNAQSIIEENIKRQALALSEIKRRSFSGDAEATRTLPNLQSSYEKSLAIRDTQRESENLRNIEREQARIDRKDRLRQKVQGGFFAGSLALPFAGALGSSFIKNRDQQGAVNDFFSNAGLALTLGIGGGPVGLTAAGLGVGLSAAKGFGDFRTAGVLGIEGRQAGLESSQARASFNTQQFQAVQQLFSALEEAKVEGNAKVIQELLSNLSKTANQIFDPGLQTAARAALGGGNPDDIRTQLSKALGEFQEKSNRDIAQKEVGLTIAELANKGKGLFGELRGVTFTGADQVKDFAGRVAAAVDVSKLSTGQRDKVSFLAQNGSDTASILESLGLTELSEQIKQVGFVNRYWNETLGTSIASLVNGQISNEKFAKSMQDVVKSQSAAITSAKNLSNSLRTLIFQRGSDNNFAFDKNIAAAEEKLSQVSSPTARLLGESTIGKARINQSTINDISEVFSKTSDEILTKLQGELGGKGKGAAGIQSFVSSQVKGNNLTALIGTLSGLESESEESKNLQKETIDALLQIKDRHDKELQKLDEISKIRFEQNVTSAARTFTEGVRNPDTVKGITTALTRAVGGPQRINLDRAFQRANGRELFTPTVRGTFATRTAPGSREDQLRLARTRNQYSRNRLDLFDSVSQLGLNELSDSRRLAATPINQRAKVLEELRQNRAKSGKDIEPLVRNSILSENFVASSSLVNSFASSDQSKVFSYGSAKNPFEELKKTLELGDFKSVSQVLDSMRSSVRNNTGLSGDQRIAANERLDTFIDTLRKIIDPVRNEDSLNTLVRADVEARLGGDIPAELEQLVTLTDIASKQLESLDKIQSTSKSIEAYLTKRIDTDLAANKATSNFSVINSKVQEAFGKAEMLSNSGAFTDEVTRMGRIKSLLGDDFTNSKGLSDALPGIPVEDQLKFYRASLDPTRSGENIAAEFKEIFDVLSRNFPKAAGEISGKKAIDDIYLTNGKLNPESLSQRANQARAEAERLQSSPEYNTAKQAMASAQSDQVNLLKGVMQQVTSTPLKLDTAGLQEVVSQMKDTAHNINQNIQVTISSAQEGFTPDEKAEIEALLKRLLEERERRSAKIKGGTPPIS